MDKRKSVIINRLLFTFLFIAIFSPSLTVAKVFRNSYIQFELPHGWDCNLKKTAYLCRYKISQHCRANPKEKVCTESVKKSREALIILSAQETRPTDTLKSYSEYLANTKNFTTESGATSQSKLIHNKAVNIKKEKWLDAMHLSRELPYYYTRYLVSIKGKVAVLVTFSAHKLYYTNYSNRFFKIIKSLKVVANNISQVKPTEISQKPLSHPLDIPNELFETPANKSPQGEDPLSKWLFYIAFLLLVIGIYIWIKNKK